MVAETGETYLEGLKLVLLRFRIGGALDFLRLSKARFGAVGIALQPSFCSSLSNQPNLEIQSAAGIFAERDFSRGRRTPNNRRTPKNLEENLALPRLITAS